MIKSMIGLAVLAAALVATPVQASGVSTPRAGNLAVFDEAKYFSAEGIDRAKSILSGTQFDQGLIVTVDTYPEPPSERKAAVQAAVGDAQKWHNYLHDWAVDHAKGDKERGIYILICAKPGGVAVIADRQTRERGFSKENEQKVRDTLVNSFKKANQEPDTTKRATIRDSGLKSAMEFIASNLKNTKVAGDAKANTHTQHRSTSTSTGMGIGGWICLGVVALLGVWLVIGLFRALSGGGGGGGGGMGGGAGGGGFMTSLFGGLFGAMAGMWLYNNMFGHGGMFGGSDAYAGDSPGGDTGGNYDTGAGDFSGDDGASGGFDDAGGGDFGGGGGDFGGGDF
jgi:hypothetical protein